MQAASRRFVGPSVVHTTARVNEAVVEEHRDEAAFQWRIRDLAAYAPNYDLRDLARQDDKVGAHLDGLVLADELGWRMCAETADASAGALFCATTVAALRRRPHDIVGIIDQAVTPEDRRAAISGLAWAPWDAVEATIREGSSSVSPTRRFVSVAVWAVSRRNPGPMLLRHLEDPDAEVRARVLRAVGELGLRNQGQALARGLCDDDPSCRAWAAWSASVVTRVDRAVVEALEVTVEHTPELAEEAATALMRVLPTATALPWARQRLADPARAVVGAAAAASLGLPMLVDELLPLCSSEDQAVARAAGDAITSIVDVDLEREDLVAEAPPLPSPENEQAAEQALDERDDGGVPLPDADRLSRWWERNRARVALQTPLLAGRPMNEAGLAEVLAFGSQRRRWYAAVELVRRRHDPFVHPVAAHGVVQGRHLLRWS